MIIRIAFVILLLIPMAASANLLGAPFSVIPALAAMISKSLFVLSTTNTFIANAVP
jgi:hypothetical protein